MNIIWLTRSDPKGFTLTRSDPKGFTSGSSGVHGIRPHVLDNLGYFTGNQSSRAKASASLTWDFKWI
jgi:hypothetical protein